MVPPNDARTLDSETGAARGGVESIRSGCAADLAWVFLLPRPPRGNFEQLVLLGGSEEMAARIRQMGIAREVTCELPNQRVADAVVRLSGAEASLESAARCLLPGGVLYGEVERSPPFGSPTPRQIRRSLEQVGLTQTGSFWCHHGFEKCVAYVPLASQNAVRWYLSSALDSHSLTHKFRHFTFALLARGGEQVSGYAVRYYAVTAVKGSRSGALPAVLGLPSVPSPLRHPDVQLLVLVQGAQRIVLLPFSSDDDVPLAALKVSRSVPAGVSLEEKEQAILSAVREKVSDSIRSTIPPPLGVVRWGGLVIGIESGAPGRMLFQGVSTSRQKMDDLRRAIAWLAEFHHQTQTTRVRWGGSVPQLAMERSLAAYAECIEVSPQEAVLFEETLNRSQRLADLTVPLAWVHGDFHGGNVFRNADQLTVIDWGGSTEGLPVLDLIKFVTTWHSHFRDSRSDSQHVESFGRLYAEPGHGGPAVREAYHGIARYLTSLQVDRRLFPIFVVKRYVDKAVRSYQFILQNKGAAEAANSVYVKYVQALAAHPHSFFQQFQEKWPSE